MMSDQYQQTFTTTDGQNNVTYIQFIHPNSNNVLYCKEELQEVKSKQSLKVTRINIFVFRSCRKITLTRIMKIKKRLSKSPTSKKIRWVEKPSKCLNQLWLSVRKAAREIQRLSQQLRKSLFKRMLKVELGLEILLKFHWFYSQIRANQKVESEQLPIRLERFVKFVQILTKDTLTPRDRK